MRIIHTADLHLGTTTYGRIDPSTGINTRITDFFTALDQIIDYSIKEEADLLLICGDTFKDVMPTSTLLKMFASRLRRATSENLEIAIILGNHDSPKSIGKAAPPEVFQELELTRIKVFSNPDYLDYTFNSGEILRLFVLPYLHPIQAITKVENIKDAQTQFNHEILKKAYHRIIAEKIERFSQLGKGEADACILAAHLFIEGSRQGSERLYILGEEFTVSSSLILSGAFDYIALGHIHTHQRIPEKIPIVYSGSIERIDFSEAGEEKGFIDLKIEEGHLKWKFIPLQIRRMIKLQIDCGDTNDPTAAIMRSLDSPKLKDAIARVEVKAHSESKSRIDTDKISNLLKDTSWSQIIFNWISKEGTADTDISWSSLHPKEALQRYLKTLKISTKEKKCVEDLGSRIIDEAFSEDETD